MSVMRGAYLLNSRAAMAVGIAAEAALLFFVITRIKRLKDVLPSKTLARIFRAEIDVYRYAFGQPLLGTRTTHTGGSRTDALCFTHEIRLDLHGTQRLRDGLNNAVARSFAALPLVVDADRIKLRKGLLASLNIPRTAIASVPRKQESPPATRGSRCLPIPRYGSRSTAPYASGCRWDSRGKCGARRSRLTI